MLIRNAGLILLMVAVLTTGVASAEPGERITGAMTATQTDSMTVWLEWTVDSVTGVLGFKLLRVADPQQGTWQFINDEPLPPESPGSYEDTDVWAGTEFRYRLYAVMAVGPDLEVEGAYCVVNISGSPVDQESWARIKTLFR